MSLGLDKKQGGREQWGLGLLLSAERSKTLHSHIEMTARAVRPTRQWKIPLVFQSKLWEHNKDINYKNVNPAPQKHLTLNIWHGGHEFCSEPIRQNDAFNAFNKSRVIYGWLRSQRQLGTCWGGPLPKISLYGPMLRGVSCFFWERLKGPSGWNLQVESLNKISPQQIMAFVGEGAKSQ